MRHAHRGTLARRAATQPDAHRASARRTGNRPRIACAPAPHVSPQHGGSSCGLRAHLAHDDALVALVALLAREVGAAPGRETRALAEAIRRGAGHTL